MNKALPRSLGNPTSLRIAAITPSMLIGIGLPIARVSAASSAAAAARWSPATSASRATDRSLSSRGSRRLCWRWPKPGIRLPCARQSATRSSAAADWELLLAARDASTTAAMTCIADSTAAPWNSPRVRSPAAAAAWRVAPPEMAVRAANTDGAPAPWSMLATMTASIKSGRRGIGELAGVEQMHDGGERNRADQFGEVVAADRDRLGRGLGERRRPHWWS